MLARRLGSATRSTLEYFSSRSSSKLWFTAMKTYFVIAAAIEEAAAVAR